MLSTIDPYLRQTVMKKEKGMQQLTDEEYANKFCLMIFLDKKMIGEMDGYADNIRHILESYSFILKSHPSMVIEDEETVKDPEEMKSVAAALLKLCTSGAIENTWKEDIRGRRKLLSLLAEALYRAMVLVAYYVKDGAELISLIRDIYLENPDRSTVQICLSHGMGRATFYRKKKEALRYLGYFFYSIVLPDMMGKI